MAPAREAPTTDAAFSKALHGTSAAANSSISAMLKKDHKAHNLAVDEYLSYWPDSSTHSGDEEARTARLASYTTISKRYYDLVTDVFEYTNGPSLHYAQIFPGQPLSEAIKQHENYLASKLNLSQGQKVLDVGCGVGGPARQIARSTGVNIVGLNCNDYQLQRALRYTEIDNLSTQVTFTKGDFMKISLEAESFDAAYSIEATSYAPSLQDVYTEVFKTLKPGSKFAVYELIMTDNYENDNPKHREMREAIEKTFGLTNLVKISEAIEAMQAAGFEVQESEDLACRDGTIPWTYLMAGSLSTINSFWDIGRIVKMRLARSVTLVGIFEAVGILPPGSQKVAASMQEGIDLLVRAGEQNLFTPIFFMVGRKPL